MLGLDLEHHSLVLKKLARRRGYKLTYVDASSLVFLDRLDIGMVWGTDRDLSIEGARVIPVSA